MTVPTAPKPAAAGSPKPSRRRFTGIPVACLSLSLLFLLEFFLFDHFGSHRVTGIYPRWNDQIQYLSEAYTGYEYGRAHGLAAAMWHTLVNPSAQGTLHDFAALIEFQLVGPSRSAALALNMLALISWQIALFIAVSRVIGSRAFGLAVAILPLALRGPWLAVPGSAYDFRLDHLAMCALGVTSALAVLSDGFRKRGWSLAMGAATGITLLTRFLTGVYFVVIFAALLAWALARRERGRRVINLLVAAAVALVIAGPILWLNREWVWNYYYIGHYIGPESAIRNQNFGVGRSLAFVWGWLGHRHLGAFFGGFATVVGMALGVARFVLHRRRATSFAGGEAAESRETLRTVHAANLSEAAHCHPLGDIIYVGLAFVLAPALILTLHPQKSEVVESALVPGAILLVAALWLVAAGRRLLASRNASPALGAVALGSAIAAISYFGARQIVPIEDPAWTANLRQANGIADLIYRESQDARIERPRVSVDYITDAFDGQVLRVICYERHHRWVDFDMRLPTGIAAPDPALVRRRVAQSDFVFLTTKEVHAENFPYDRTLAQLRPELLAWCNSHLRVVRRFDFCGRPMELFERRGLRAEQAPVQK